MRGLLSFSPVTKKIKYYFLGAGMTTFIAFTIGWMMALALVKCECAENKPKKKIPTTETWFFAALTWSFIRWIL